MIHGERGQRSRSPLPDAKRANGIQQPQWHAARWLLKHVRPNGEEYRWRSSRKTPGICCRFLRISSSWAMSFPGRLAIVIAVEEPFLMMPVQRVVGDIEIENDLLRRRLGRLQE